MEHLWTQIAAQQHGVVSRDQLLDAGLTRHQIEHLRTSGLIEPLRRGIYRAPGAPDGWHARAMGVVLTDPRLLLSHASAARIWGFDLLGPAEHDVLEVVTSSKSRIRLRGVRSHQSDLIPPQDRARREGFPITSAARTVVDLSPRLDPVTLRTLVDQCLRTGSARLADIHSCVARLQGPGRRDTRLVRQLLDQLTPAYRPGESPLESHIAQAIVDGGLPAPVMQHRVVVPSGRSYRLDLAYPWWWIGIEADSWEHHRTRLAFERDRARANEIVAAGWNLLHITARMSASQITHVVGAAIERARRAS